MTTTSPRAWQVVLDAVELDLLEGRLSPGDHLPPERTLAADLGVGRSSVREALRVLEVLGLIRTAVGSGPSAGAIIVARPDGAMSSLMRLQVAAQGFEVADVVKTRLILEGSIVRALAGASHTAPIDLAGPAQILTAMECQPLTQAEFLALDTQFHLSLAEAGGNQVVTATMAGLRSAIEGYARAGAAGLENWSATSARLKLEHRGILAAILAGETDAAHRAVHAHISGYYAETHLTFASLPTTR